MEWPNNVRILAMFAVVFLHVAGEGLIGSTDLNTSHWWIANSYDALFRWSVPVFVMLSGALLLADGKAESASVFYKKRLTKLLYPTLFWIVFYLLWDALPGIFRGKPPTIMALGMKVLSGKPHSHLWFLYMLMGLYLVTPFVRVLVRNTPPLNLLGLTGIMFCLAAVNSASTYFTGQQDDLFINWFLSYLPYFIAGHLLAVSLWQPSPYYAGVFFSLSVLLTALGCFVLSRSYYLDIGVYFYDYLSITVIPMSISVMVLLMKLKKPILVTSLLTNKLASLTLGIYFIHPLVGTLLKNYAKLSIHVFHPLFSIPLISLVIFTLTALIAWCIQLIPYVRRII